MSPLTLDEGVPARGMLHRWLFAGGNIIFRNSFLKISIFSQISFSSTMCYNHIPPLPFLIPSPLLPSPLTTIPLLHPCLRLHIYFTPLSLLGLLVSAWVGSYHARAVYQWLHHRKIQHHLPWQPWTANSFSWRDGAHNPPLSPFHVERLSSGKVSRKHPRLLWIPDSNASRGWGFFQILPLFCLFYHVPWTLGLIIHRSCLGLSAW